jgi:hypothetical protein
LLRIPSFVGHEGDKEEMDHWKNLCSARRAITREDKALSAKHTISSLAGSTTEIIEPISQKRVRDVTSNWIKDIKHSYDGRIIRRTVESKTFDGRKINDTLPPYKMIIIPVVLCDDEEEIVTEVMEQITTR